MYLQVTKIQNVFVLTIVVLKNSNECSKCHYCCVEYFVDKILSKSDFLNTRFMTNPTIVSPVKMEYGWNFSISGQKMMVKSGLEEIFLKFLHALAIFY